MALGFTFLTTISFLISQTEALYAQISSSTWAVVLDDVEGATMTNSQSRPGTQVFLRVAGAKSRDIYVFGNELHQAETPFKVDAGVPEGTVKSTNNF